ncbi:heavy-metal-associated domain-containing protein [Bacillus sp. B-jedd]|uniref:heavy-metal-associated domain-containing protein n=1 Tax=Bacillus sp. B-jedd TaxID=1476857 RepID=UPI0005155909|nr:heavy-metal-associated domain-containing protein [Bacillus sp. B-jedd]CEG28873.1 Heavy metal transport/detoxification protein [Bacillus sp. B-jedd]
MKKAVYQLDTLTCPSCVKRIETALIKTAGIISVKVLFNLSKVKAEFNEEQISADRVGETLKKLGYPVLSAKVS